eukprot:3940660-Rhodomonas_salina.1
MQCRLTMPEADPPAFKPKTEPQSSWEFDFAAAAPGQWHPVRRGETQPVLLGGGGGRACASRGSPAGQSLRGHHQAQHLSQHRKPVHLLKGSTIAFAEALKGDLQAEILHCSVRRPALPAQPRLGALQRRAVRAAVRTAYLEVPVHVCALVQGFGRLVGH